eukprot:gene24031-64396_t
MADVCGREVILDDAAGWILVAQGVVLAAAVVLQLYAMLSTLRTLQVGTRRDAGIWLQHLTPQPRSFRQMLPPAGRARAFGQLVPPAPRAAAPPAGADAPHVLSGGLLQE